VTLSDFPISRWHFAIWFHDITLVKVLSESRISFQIEPGCR
jgi:hypothetical protein